MLLSLLSLIILFASNAAFQAPLSSGDNAKLPAAVFQDYIGAICVAKDRCADNSCDSSPQRGCICYNNGTLVPGDVSKCTNCKDPEIFAVLEGHNCPDNYPGLCKHVVQLEYCPPHRYEACVCTVEGVCTNQLANNCLDCKNESVLAIFQGNCPFDLLQCKGAADCNCNEQSKLKTEL